METILNNLHIVLVGTSHPGNIGGAARAMKNMGLSGLRLVRPARFPSAEATARASGADDVLAAAACHATLSAAVADCTLVLGTSARSRSLPWPTLDARAAARRAADAARHGPVAIVFGCEQSGLSNEELAHCAAVVSIPADPVYSSLNLAAAVQILAYELRLAAGAPGVAASAPDADSAPAPAADLERLYEHLEAVLVQVGFLDPSNPRHTMRRLRRLLGRAGPDRNEVAILRGILTAVQSRCGRG